MKEYIIERVLDIAEHILLTGDTVRGSGKKFNVSKSTVHKDISDRLFEIDPELYEKVRLVVDINLAERHIRGGMATKAKYENINK